MYSSLDCIKIYSCSRLVQFELRNPSLLASNEKISPSGPDPVLIAGDCGGVPGSSDPVSTAARRGDGSHSDDGSYERMISIRKPSTSTFICRLNFPGYEGIQELPCFYRRKGLERGWCWCESVFHPSRQPFQYGRSQTLASRPYASRALANYAFALDGASRQASRLEPFLEDARSLFLDLPTSLHNRALRQ